MAQPPRAPADRPAPDAPTLDPGHARAPIVTPRSGPTGAAVRVTARNLPAVTPVHLGLGASRAGFEVLAPLVTDQRGELSTVVEVPDWATTDRAHYFVLVDVYFRPMSVSAAFHVTGPDGLLRRSGRIARPADGCLLLRETGAAAGTAADPGDGAETYVLIGPAVGPDAGGSPDAGAAGPAISPAAGTPDRARPGAPPGRAPGPAAGPADAAAARRLAPGDDVVVEGRLVVEAGDGACAAGAALQVTRVERRP